ncbi:MAG: hypothetical protein O3A00_27285 [Planctomycetota bacterium]|nr:hypothetical protein [Planctomycetota bacterium]
MKFLDSANVLGGTRGLVALAMIKGGRDESHPSVQKLMAFTLARCRTGKYVTEFTEVYGIALDVMLLANANAAKYRPQIQMITDYILARQHGSGPWDYPGTWQGGDTSQTQYALLGLWAAQRAGIDIPIGAIENAARWLIKTQQTDGGFRYHPVDPTGVDMLPQDLSMTSAGAATLGIARIMLYPDAMKEKPKKKVDKKKFGILQKVEVEAPEEEKKAEANSRKPSMSIQSFSTPIQRAFGWMTPQFRVVGIGSFSYYYLYTIERLFALENKRAFAGRDWYGEGSSQLIKLQESDGSWKKEAGRTNSGVEGQTAFAILFLARATGRVLGNVPPAGAGLLKGDRGLRADLTLTAENGKVVEKKDLGPLDQLLDQLSKVDNLDVEEVQKAIVEKVQVGDREKLIKERDKLVMLVDHANPELRRISVWALGRTDNIRDARLLIGRLKNDTSVDVMVEARYALCSLARRPRGFGLSPLPFKEGEYEAMTEKQRQERITEWREETFDKWSRWYMAVRPFDERADIAPFDRKYRDQPPK